MHKYKISLKILLPFIVSIINITYANTFEPSTTPLITKTLAKPNIHLVLDHSWVVNNKVQDTWIPEHAYNFGDPVCMPQENSWRNDRKARGEYDPFSQGHYLPWDDRKTDINGLINGLKKPPRIERCVISKRSDGIAAVFQDVFDRYKDQAYLGASYFSFVNPISSTQGQTSLALPIDDYSNTSIVYDIRFQNIRKEIRNHAPVASAFYPGVYEAIKYMRGQGMSKESVDFQAESWYAPMKKRCVKGECYYSQYWHASPVRYRCQNNHMVTLTGGVPEKYRNFGIAQEDNINLVHHKGYRMDTNPAPYTLYTMAYSDDLPSKKLGEIAAKTDLRYNKERRAFQGSSEYAATIDKAGKDWRDKNSIAMPINMHTVLFNNERADWSDMKERLSNITGPTNGMKIRYENRYDNTVMLQAALDILVAPTITSRNGFAAVDDRKVGEINEEVFTFNDAKPDDTSRMGTIRYQTSYDFNDRRGYISAVVPYLAEEIPEKGDPRIQVYTIFATGRDATNTKRYLTFLKASENGLKFDELKNSQVKDKFEEIYKNTHWSGDLFLDTYINWLSTDHISDASYVEYPEYLRKRTTPYGSITSADIVLANKDELNINIAKDKMSKNLSSELVNFLKFKAQTQPTNLLIVSDNNGFISFVNARRGLTGNEKVGDRNTAYFPQMLVHRFNEIAKLNRPATLIFDGKTNLVDAKVHSPSLGDLYATIGMTSMGAGGKGIVGYRIYAAEKSSVDNWVENPKGSPPSIAGTDPINKVIPLFEITNEGPEVYRTKGFEDLGYTYSGFEFFNQINNGVGQSIAVFGNGFGTEKSVLYFIDAYTGKKLHEIVLNKAGGGASTPSIIVRNSTNDRGQILDRIYVGDYSGNLYKIQFNSDYFTNNTKVTSLFKVPTQYHNNVEMKGQSAISIKPLVVKNIVSEDEGRDKDETFYSIAFGSGIAANHSSDRGNNSLVTHNIYNIVDHDHAINESNLKSGTINYHTKPSNYSDRKQYQLNSSKTTDDLYSSSGWYRKLSADDSRSGERIIHTPKYDSTNNAIVFSTWGIREQSTDFDPCIPNEPFNKLLSLDINNGGNIDKKK